MFLHLRSFCSLDILIFLLNLGLFLLINSAESNAVRLFTNHENEKEMLDVLLLNSSYDRRIRPQNKTTIEVNVLLHSLTSPTESSLNYEVEFLLHRKWIDPRLKYDDGGRHKYLNGLNHAKNIWMPNTYIVKHGSLKNILPDMSLRIYSNGTVIHTLRRGIAINCQGNLKIFPFDNPKCPFAIESGALENEEMRLQWSEHNPLEKASSIQLFNAYLVKIDMGTCGEMITWRGNYSCLHVLLIFTRDKIYYFSSVFVPGMILVTSAFMSFWLEKGMVPARVMIGVTTMLSFCTTTNNFRSSLPVVSSLTAMNLWDGVCMFFIYTSLLEFVLVNYLFRKRPKKFSTESSIQLQKGHQSHPGSEQKDIDIEAKAGIPYAKSNAMFLNMPPKELSYKIEKVAKIVFPTCFIIFVVCYFTIFAVILPNNSDNWEIQSAA